MTDTPRRRGTQADDDTDDAAKTASGRKQRSVSMSLWDALMEQRNRIEGSESGLPQHRWRSQLDYLDAAMALGLQHLETVPPISRDPMAAIWSQARKQQRPASDGSTNGHANALAN